MNFTAIHILSAFGILFTFFQGTASSKTVVLDEKVTAEYLKKCKDLKKYSVKSLFSTECFSNYHHFNSKAYSTYYKERSARSKKNLKIASYNVWHSGEFKDTAIMAQVMNKFDLVGAVELRAVSGSALIHNNNMKKFLANGPKLTLKLTKAIDKERSRSKKSILKKKLAKLKKDLKEAPSLLKMPVYLKVLIELQKIDRSWALILSPRGDASKEDGAQEVSGVFYRSRYVKPKINEHCYDFKQRRSGTAYACLPNLRESFMGRNTGHLFSRRPFISSFESGNFDFTYVVSHSIFESPQEQDRIEQIMQDTFGTNSYKDLKGLTKSNYARVSEVSLIFELVENLKSNYSEQDIIMAGDYNLKSTEKFWPWLLKEFKGQKLLVEGATSLKPYRYFTRGKRKGEKTNGVSSNYDHFFINEKHTRECDSSSAKVFNIYDSSINDLIERKYLIRSTSKVVREMNKVSFALKKEGYRYDYNIFGKQKEKELVAKYKKELSKLRVIKRNVIQVDEKRNEVALASFKRRVLTEQFSDKTYYKFYKEILSDHLPITMNCSTTKNDDD